MAKRRNKNKKAGPVKIIRPESAAPVAAESAPLAEAAPVEDAAVATTIDQDALPPVDAAAVIDAAPESMADEGGFAVDAVAFDAASADASPPDDAGSGGAGQAELNNDVAASASSEAPVGDEEIAAVAPLPEFMEPASEWAQGPHGQAFDESPATPPESTPESIAAAALAAEPEPEPEPEPSSEVIAELAPEPEPERVGPSEPRIAAFAKLSEYQTLSLAHVAGLPEEADVPGHWRGVGFAIGGRRLVAGFDEVVEVIRMPVVTHVPGTQPWMLGVANVRGTLLPVVDLKQFLEGERTVVYEGQRVMVVRQGGGNVAVLIDQLFGQRTFNDSHKADVAVGEDGRYGHFIKQVYRVGGNDWAVFSMAMLTRTPEFRQAAA